MSTASHRRLPGPTIAVIEMEIAEITKHLERWRQGSRRGLCQRIFFRAIRLRRRIQLRGLDYVPEMIEQARDAASLQCKTNWSARLSLMSAISRN